MTERNDISAMATGTPSSAASGAPAATLPQGLTGLRRLLMRSFTRRASELSQSAWSRSAVVFAPHQDDETLGCGGTILKKRANGAHVTIVFLTDGRQSHAGRLPLRKLTALRHAEALAAANVLGVAESDVITLGFSDGRLRDSADEARERVAAVLRERQPEEIYVTYHRDHAPDHAAAADIVGEVAAHAAPKVVRFEYPIWFWNYWPFASRTDLANSQIIPLMRQTLRGASAMRRAQLVRVPIADVRATKWAALQCHATQMQHIDGDPQWPALGDVWSGRFLDCFFDDHELLVRVSR